VTEELRRQLAELVAVHKGLTNISERNSEVTVAGALPFEASAEGLETIIESFDIELAVPHDFPETLPRVRETGGRIGPDYDHRNPSGALCLGVPLEQRRVLLEQPTLLGFVNRLVIPFLYGYAFFEKNGRHPFGEAAHGSEGILRYYVDTLGLRDEVAVLSVICYLWEYGYRGHHDCPCGSGRKVRACHRAALMALSQAHNQQSLRSDFIAVLELCWERVRDGRVPISQALRRQLVRLLRRLEVEG